MKQKKEDMTNEVKMYEVLDADSYRNIKIPSIKLRKRPLNGFFGSFVLKPGTNLRFIPADTKIYYRDGVWEAHTKEKNKKIRENIAKKVDAIAFL